MGDKKFLNDDEKWDYTKLSTLAKDHGGPENLLDDVYDEGHSDGKIQGQVEGGIYTLVGTAVIAITAFASVKIGKYFKKRSAKSKEELHKEYDSQANVVEEYCSVCGKITRFCFNGKNWECQSCGEYNTQAEHRDSENIQGEE